MFKYYMIDNELPYRVEIDGARGAGKTYADAIITALSVSNRIPKGMRDRREVARYLFWHYDPGDAGWGEIIGMLERGN